MGMKSEEHQEISQKMNHISLNMVHSSGSENCEWAMYPISAYCWHLCSVSSDSSVYFSSFKAGLSVTFYIALPQDEYNSMNHVKVYYCDIYCSQKIL